MKNPADSDFYLKPLESLLEELNPAQRKQMAAWIREMSYYSRELIATIQLSARVSDKLIKEKLTVSGDTSLLDTSLENVTRHATYLKTMFDDIHLMANRYEPKEEHKDG